MIVMIGAMVNVGWGQTNSFLGLDGGFEGTATVDNTATGDILPRAAKWVKANTYITIALETSTVRSGNNSLKVSSSSSSTSRVWSPLVTFSESTSKWVVQYYRRASSTTATVQNQTYNYRGTTEQGNGTYSTVTATDTWQKVTYSPTSTTSATQGAAGILAKMANSAGDMYYDDFTLYESSTGVDVTAPDAPTASSVGTPTSSSLTVGWTAPETGTDGGGYLVVRGTSDPTTTPNVNGIYAVGNTIASGMIVAYQGTNTNFVDNGLSADTQYFYRIYTYDKAYNYSLALTANGTTSAGSSPTISTSTSTLSDFTYVEGSGPSTDKTFTVSGAYLTNDISIAASTNFEISKTGGSGYTSPLTLTQSGGTVSETTIHVRLKAGLSVGSYSSENIVCSSSGADNKNVTCSGTVYKTEPSNHVTSFTAVKDGTYGYSRIDLSWTENDGSVVPDGYLIKASTADNITNPSDGTAVSDNTTIGSNSGAVNISHGTTSYEWTGLTPEQTYYFKIFTYTNSGTNINYKTDGTIPSANATTDAAPVLPKVIITEVADHSTYQSEYVEIYNADNLAVNIDGWVLRERYAADNTSSRYITLNSANQKNTGGSDYLTLSPGEYAISLRSTDYASFKSTYSIGDNVAIFQNSTTAVPQINGNERYQLENVGGDVIDSFGDWDRAPIFEVTQNYCYERINGSSSNGELSSNWISTVNSSYNYTPAKVNDTSLPVELESFIAQPSGNAVSLTWVTESEIENQGFNLYRKLFGGEYALLSSFLENSALVGQGTTTQKHVYTYTDRAVQSGATYVYQLADVDYAGQETKHKEVEVKVEAESKGLVGDYRLRKAYPNPFNASFTIPLELGVSLPVDVRLYDVSGACVRTIRNEILSAGIYHLTTDTCDLTSGIYLLRMRVGNQTETQKIVLMK